jgi:hypothetical protein
MVVDVEEDVEKRFDRVHALRTSISGKRRRESEVGDVTAADLGKPYAIGTRVASAIRPPPVDRDIATRQPGPGFFFFHTFFLANDFFAHGGREPPSAPPPATGPNVRAVFFG